MSIFRKRPSKSPADESPKSLFNRKASTRVSPDMGKVHLDDYGRVLASPQPAFTNSKDSNPDDDFTELELIFGYTPIETSLELDLHQTESLVKRCAKEIKTRGLDTPLILSSMSLDISMEDATSLIRAYVSNLEAWAYDLHLATPLAVGAFMKWGLCRFQNEHHGRGFLNWIAYHEFKLGEKANAYPPRYIVSHFINRLPKTTASLTGTLLSLFSSIAAYSNQNGMTPRKLASLFSPYFFGLPDDKSFDETYIEWQAATDALEHLLLAFVREQGYTSRQLPTHLEKFVAGYPQVLNVTYGASNQPKIPKGARVEEVLRVKRLTRFHSRNLIDSAGSWKVPGCADWKLFYPLQAGDEDRPLFTSSYRHLLNMKGSGAEDIQRYKSVVQKEWSMFGELGFKDVDKGKLEFDLEESDRNRSVPKHETRDWGSFLETGFGDKETFSATDLIFRQNITQTVQSWPDSKLSVTQKIKAAEERLPPFPYDTTPAEGDTLLVDANFFEAWADVLVSGGWARDELKECCFSLVHWKARIRPGEIAKKKPDSSGDDRTEERWVLLEEFVPRDYREELKEGKSKKTGRATSFLRSVRKKKEPPPIRLNVSQLTPQLSHSPSGTFPSSPLYSSAAAQSSKASFASRKIDESIFNLNNGTTTKISLSSKENLSVSQRAPSLYSTVAVVGHNQPPLVYTDDYPIPEVPTSPVAETMLKGLPPSPSMPNITRDFNQPLPRTAPYQTFPGHNGQRRELLAANNPYSIGNPNIPNWNDSSASVVSRPMNPHMSNMSGVSLVTAATENIQISPPSPRTSPHDDFRPESTYSADPYGGMESESDTSSVKQAPRPGLATEHLEYVQTAPSTPGDSKFSVEVMREASQTAPRVEPLSIPVKSLPAIPREDDSNPSTPNNHSPKVSRVPVPPMLPPTQIPRLVSSENLLPARALNPKSSAAIEHARQYTQRTRVSNLVNACESRDAVVREQPSLKR